MTDEAPSHARYPAYVEHEALVKRVEVLEAGLANINILLRDLRIGLLGNPPDFPEGKLSEIGRQFTEIRDIVNGMVPAFDKAIDDKLASQQFGWFKGATQRIVTLVFCILAGVIVWYVTTQLKGTVPPNNTVITTPTHT